LRLIIADNDSSDPRALRYLEQISRDERVTVLRVPGEFNYSAINNAAARSTESPLLLLLNNDVIVRDAGWLREMVGLVSRPGVGAVGAKLLFENDLVQHGGVILGLLGVANHAHKFVHNGEPGYAGRLHLLQEMSAVTAACMLTRRSAYEQVGGLDEVHLPVAYNDIDYCLKLREAGWRVLWTPYAELVHLESVSRGSEGDPQKLERFEAETQHFTGKWAAALQHDPSYNPNLSVSTTDFSLAEKPRRQRPWKAYLT
jgi:GT2 family glycosyltransferase